MRRINHTGRRRITRDRVTIRVATGTTVLVSVDADLRDDAFEAGASVVLDVNRKVQSDRIHLGPADRVVAVRNHPISFDTAEGLTFDLLVVAPSDGLLLGVAAGLRPVSDRDDIQSILPIRPADLGERIWKLDLQDRPLVEINNRLSDWNDFVNQPIFHSLVFPEVLEQIADAVLRTPLIESGDRLDEWSALLDQLGWPIESRPDPEFADDLEIRETCRQIVHDFCNLHGVTARIDSSGD